MVVVGFDTLKSLPVSQQRGSRARCILLTEGERFDVAQRLEALTGGNAAVTADNYWLPAGCNNPQEAKLGEVPGFLSAIDRQAVTQWWPLKTRNANTPNWDIAATIKIDGRDGLLLVEAKAHSREWFSGGKGPGHPGNHERIGTAIEEANRGLNMALPGWNLSRDANYQLANRFAWSWRLASLGYPVILVFLGFLNAVEMRDRGEPFRSEDEWSTHVMEAARGTVPMAAWGKRIPAGPAFIVPLLRSISLSFD